MILALVVEDDDRHAEAVADALRGLALVHRVETADEALAALRWVVPDVLLADVRGTTDASPLEHAVSLRLALDTAGAHAAARAGAHAVARAPTPLVLVSASEPGVLRAVADALVAVHACPKPFHALTLRALVARVTGVSP